MQYRVAHDPDLHMIELTIAGDFTPDQAGAIIEETIALAKETGCYSILADYRAAIIDFSALDIYDFPKLLSTIAESFGLRASMLKRAVVATANQKELGFFETVTVNRAQNLKIFGDIESAKKWLLDE